MPIVVQLRQDVPELEEGALRDAVARELGEPVVLEKDASAPSVTVTVEIHRDSGELVVQRHDATGTLARRVPLPADPAEAMRTAVFLVGNLARDEASELLGDLRPTATPDDAGPPEAAPPAKVAETPPESPALWIGVSAEADFVFLPSANDVCLVDSNTGSPVNAAGYACFDPGTGARFPADEATAQNIVRALRARGAKLGRGGARLERPGGDGSHPPSPRKAEAPRLVRAKGDAMNGDDILARASHALRDQAREPSTEVSRTRARVLLHASRRVQRSKRALALAPLAAVFAISTAWASTHAEVPRALSRVLAFFASSGAGTSAPANERSAAVIVRPTATATVDSAPVDSRDPVPPAPPELSIEALPRTSQPSPQARGGSARVRSEPVRQAETVETAAAPADVDHQASLYAEAHRAHFVDGDPAAALRAWNAYLAAAPDGPLAPEARYNRALTLVRLGRLDEARQALEPFAREREGGYRAREAAALLEAMALRAR